MVKNVKITGMLGIMAIAFMMLFASIATTTDASVTPSINIENGVYTVAHGYNVTDKFIVVDMACIDSVGANHISNASVYLGLVGVYTLKANVISTTNTSSMVAQTIINNVADGNYTIKVVFKDGSSYTSLVSANITVKYELGTIPYTPSGITSKQDFMDYLWFGLTVTAIGAVLIWLDVIEYVGSARIKKHPELKVIGCIVLAFVLTMIIYIFIGNALADIYNYALDFLTGIWNYLVGLFNSWGL